MALDDWSFQKNTSQCLDVLLKSFFCEIVEIWGCNCDLQKHNVQIEEGGASFNYIFEVWRRLVIFTPLSTVDVINSYMIIQSFPRTKGVVNFTDNYLNSLHTFSRFVPGCIPQIASGPLSKTCLHQVDFPSDMCTVCPLDEKFCEGGCSLTVSCWCALIIVTSCLT